MTHLLIETKKSVAAQNIPNANIEMSFIVNRRANLDKDSNLLWIFRFGKTTADFTKPTKMQYLISNINCLRQKGV